MPPIGSLAKSQRLASSPSSVYLSHIPDDISQLAPFFRDLGVLKSLHAFATNKKSGYERESAAIAFQSLANILGAPVAPLLLPSLSVIFELYMDKGDVVRIAAGAAVKAILKLFPPEATRVVFRELETILDNGKWRTMVGVLDAFRSFVVPAKDAVAAELVAVLPKIEGAMHDTKQEVRELTAAITVHSDITLRRFRQPQ